jgi:formiminoglutamase
VSERKLEFHAFDWAIEPPDANDRLFGQLVSIASANAPRSDLILYGLPFDGAVLGRKGAAAGPSAIRHVARLLKAYDYQSGELHKRVFDLGDAILPPDNVSAAHVLAEQASREAKHLAYRENKKPARVVTLGGDHSLSFPCAFPYLEEFGDKLAVINIDAHLDVRSVRMGEPYNSGTSFGRLIENGLGSYTVIGAQSFQTSPAYVKRVKDAGGSIITAENVFEKGARRIATRVLAQLKKFKRIYLSVDLDVADASVAPGVSAPRPGGLLAHQIFELVRTICADKRVVACDIMELAPSLEPPNSDRTARLAAGCLACMTL